MWRNTWEATSVDDHYLSLYSSPWPHDYASELDATLELNLDLANYYQLQIGVLHWIV